VGSRWRWPFRRPACPAFGRRRGSGSGSGGGQNQGQFQNQNQNQPKIRTKAKPRHGPHRSTGNVVPEPSAIASPLGVRPFTSPSGGAKHDHRNSHQLGPAPRGRLLGVMFPLREHHFFMRLAGSSPSSTRYASVGMSLGKSRIKGSTESIASIVAPSEHLKSPGNSARGSRRSTYSRGTRHLLSQSLPFPIDRLHSLPSAMFTPNRRLICRETVFAPANLPPSSIKTTTPAFSFQGSALERTAREAPSRVPACAK